MLCPRRGKPRTCECQKHKRNNNLLEWCLVLEFNCAARTAFVYMELLKVKIRLHLFLSYGAWLVSANYNKSYLSEHKWVPYCLFKRCSCGKKEIVCFFQDPLCIVTCDGKIEQHKKEPYNISFGFVCIKSFLATWQQQQ